MEVNANTITTMGIISDEKNGSGDESLLILY